MCSGVKGIKRTFLQFGGHKIESLCNLKALELSITASKTNLGIWLVYSTWNMVENSQIDTQCVSFNHLDTRWTSSMYYRGTIGSAIFQVSTICIISFQIISIQIAILIAHFLWLKNFSELLKFWLKFSSFFSVLLIGFPLKSYPNCRILEFFLPLCKLL